MFKMFEIFMGKHNDIMINCSLLCIMFDFFYCHFVLAQFEITENETKIKVKRNFLESSNGSKRLKKRYVTSITVRIKILFQNGVFRVHI